MMMVNDMGYVVVELFLVLVFIIFVVFFLVVSFVYICIFKEVKEVLRGILVEKIIGNYDENI